MRVLFIVCITFFQIIAFQNVHGFPVSQPVDTSIPTLTGNEKQPRPSPSSRTTTTITTERRTTSRAAPMNNNTKGANSNSNGANNTDMPKTFIASGVNLGRTIKNNGSKIGTDVVNGASGFVNIGGDLAGGVSQIIREQSKNARLVASDSLKLLLGLNSSATGGIRNILRSASQIGSEQAKIMSNVLNSLSDTAIQISKTGGTIVETPISISKDAAAVAGTVAKVPKKYSRLFSNKIMNFRFFKNVDDMPNN